MSIFDNVLISNKIELPNLFNDKVSILLITFLTWHWHFALLVILL